MGKFYEALEKSRIEATGDESSIEALASPKALVEPVESVNPEPSKNSNNQSLFQAKTSPGNAIQKVRAIRRTAEKAAESKGSASYDAGVLDPNLIVLTRTQSIEAEQFKMLRSSILFPREGQPPRTIMVTSAMPGEGKTFVAGNLAISIAQSINEHVLLMDCDLRLPDVHTRFGYGPVKGLSEYLTNGHKLKNLLLNTAVDKLTLLPGGTPPPNPSELISSQKMSHLIKEVRSRYKDRIIVIDSPPPKLTSETHVIANQVDGILLVVQHDKTPRDTVSQLVGMFGKDKVLGVVYNWYEKGVTNRFGYQKYGYGQNGKYYAKKK